MFQRNKNLVAGSAVRSIAMVVMLVGLMTTSIFGQGKQLTFEDIMKWEDITDPAISANGEWLVYGVSPDRGDGEVRVRHIDDGTIFTIELGDDPAITRTGNWVAAYIKPELAEELKAEKEKPRQGLALLNTQNGETVRKDSVRAFSLSNDGSWIAIHHHQSKEVEDKKSKNKHLGTNLVLRHLEEGTEYEIPFVKEAAFDSTSNHLVYSVVDTSGSNNGLFYRSLNDDPAQQRVIGQNDNGLYTNLTWHNQQSRLAFTEAALDTAFNQSDANLKLWEARNQRVRLLIDSASIGNKWALRTNNDLDWTKDGERIFFGVMPQDMVDLENKQAEEEKSDSAEIDIYDMDEILDEKELDVWHWDDPRIKTHERETWNSRKNRVYRAVYHLNKNRWVQLADKNMPEVSVSENSNYALGSSRKPYLKEMTWDGFFDDYYIVDLQNANREKIAKRLRFGASLSPGGRYVVFYRDKNWHLYDTRKKNYRNLTEGIKVPFYNEDHDYPYPAPGYGVAGWTTDDEYVLIYDKYDIWKIPTGKGNTVNLTQDGRDREITYRIRRIDRNREAFRKDEEVLVRGYYDKKKYYGFYTLKLDETGTTRRLEDEKKFDFVAKAEDSNRLIYTRESYDEYPNLWVSNGQHFDEVKRISELNLDLHDKYNWGTAELIEWQSMDDGRTIQGAVIKPDDYKEGKKYPVLIYYYRFFSQRAYEFNNITNDDRPTLPQWVSDGYVVFLPDIRFEVGTPGFASTKSLVPGVQKLIEMGIADPDKLGLHGHSWSGYQTAFMITQTDIFDAAIAGAPVSNMTSAYSGIRWGSGLARQFQYEQTQSRIGGNLWEYPERYIENSPVFYADRINTPLLIMFGDEDTAVPWYQGIELYLAMRRLEKDAIFLQYHKEPHHLQKYANRLDYAIKMKEYFDHYLRGAEAPEWIKEGVPYRGQ